MPVTQVPTLTPIDIDHNQFQVQFGLEMNPGENPLDVSVPNLGQLSKADVFLIDFQKVNTPARGNFPAFRSLQLVLETSNTTAGASEVGTIYIVNPRTSQVISLLAPQPTATQASIIFANVPFFAMSNQSVIVYRAESKLSIARLSATAFTFNCPAFYNAAI
jgi:hypothetical protein